MSEQRGAHRRLAVAAAIAGLATLMATDVEAQSASCPGLINTLRTLERNGDYQAYEDGAQDMRSLQRNVQRYESRYVREGCNDDAKARRPLSRSCKQLAAQITEGRDELKALERSMQTGSAIAQQREAILQEIARFDCGSSARVTRNDTPRSLLDELFDAFDGVDTREDQFYDYGYGYGTVRTVCVRSCDGYFWPVSYSTLPEFATNDAQQCQAQCPGADVELYYYNNPGEEPEQMVSLYGVPYSSLPNAFRYRTEYDAACTCKAPITYGQINIAQTAGGQSRAVIQFGELNFPLPLRDPRRPRTVVQDAPTSMEVAATFVSVPLPRPRPKAPGQPVPVEPVAAAPETRIVKFGDKTVRVVGPDTPYVPKAAAGT